MSDRTIITVISWYFVIITCIDNESLWSLQQYNNHSKLCDSIIPHSTTPTSLFWEYHTHTLFDTSLYHHVGTHYIQSVDIIYCWYSSCWIMYSTYSTMYSMIQCSVKSRLDVVSSFEPEFVTAISKFRQIHNPCSCKSLCLSYVDSVLFLDLFGK